MKKIKIICDSDYDTVEKTVNRWLKDNEDKITVYHEYTKYQSAGSDHYSYRYSVMLVYEERISL